jgi:LysR family glycine cleavage system transcriptional activator
MGEPSAGHGGAHFSSTPATRSRRRLGRRRLLLPPFFASELFVPRLATFCDAHPDIDIQIDTSDPHPTLHPPTSDVSIIFGESPPPGVKASKLFSLKLAAVCAKEHAADVVRLGREVFRETALIVHRPRPFAWTNWAQEVGLEAPEPKNIIELDSMFSVVRAAERGIGVALVPTALCGAWFDTGALVRIFSIELSTPGGTWPGCLPAAVWGCSCWDSSAARPTTWLAPSASRSAFA